MSPRLLFVILFTVILSACAQLALKLGVSASHLGTRGEAGAFMSLLAVAGSPLIWLGIAIYVFSMALWLWVLSRTDLSVAYPFVGVSFLATFVFGALFLHENVTPLRFAGTLLIVFGCALIARSA